MAKVEVFNTAYRSFYVHVQQNAEGNIRIHLGETPIDEVPSEIVYPKQMNEVRLWSVGERKISDTDNTNLN